MYYEADKNSVPVSVGSWMFMLLVTALPIIGFIMVIVWAFTGENETRKNYFRAILAWIVVLVGVGVVAALLVGSSPHIRKQMQGWTHKA
jgi:hypothetical protein